MAKPDRQKFIAGVVLVLFGLGFYMAQKLDALGSEVIMLIIGTAFLVAYFYQKAYGLLIPACILLGLGAGSTLQKANVWWANEGIQLGLGVGFLAIYLIARLYQKESHWWPLIPGSILTIIGVPKSAEIWAFLRAHWPLILVAIGIMILIGAFRRGSADAPEAAAAATSAAPAASPPPAEPEEPKID